MMGDERMPENSGMNARRKRRPRLPVGTLGTRLVMNELVRRGFDARLPDYPTFKHDLVVKVHALTLKPIHVRSTHVSPWYVRSANFTGPAATQVTIYVLLGNEKENSIRFFGPGH
jgi:hypothetical protein